MFNSYILVISVSLMLLVHSWENSEYITYDALIKYFCIGFKFRSEYGLTEDLWGWVEGGGGDLCKYVEILPCSCGTRS